MKLTRNQKGALCVLLLGVLLLGVVRVLRPILADRQQVQTSDAAGSKGRIVIGMDNFAGYFPLCSSQMRMRMQADGYVLECRDDKANYAARYAALKNGDLQLAVGTVDSYVVQGHATGYPAVIAAVIDQSRGADAIVARRDVVQNLDGLKTGTNKIAYTPASPSEFLLKSIGVHFDIPHLRIKGGAWRVESDGSSEALKKLVSGEAQVAVLWEPDVSKALAQPGIIKLIGTEQTDKLIVDVLLANREFMQDHAEVVRLVLANYWKTLRYYRDHSEELKREMAKYADVAVDQVDPMLRGVEWYSLGENATAWFGLGGMNVASYGLVDVINSTVRVLAECGDVAGNPLPDKDARRIMNSSAVGALLAEVLLPAKSGAGAPAAGGALDRSFEPLDEAGWARLREVGTLKTPHIIFQSGTNQLALEGKEAIDQMVAMLGTYPSFRILVEGHTKSGGEEAANRMLSAERAEAVARYLQVTYNIDQHRIRAIGLGSSRTLPRENGEAYRAYLDRLARVEIHLLTEVY